MHASTSTWAALLALLCATPSLVGANDSLHGLVARHAHAHQQHHRALAAAIAHSAQGGMLRVARSPSPSTASAGLKARQTADQLAQQAALQAWNDKFQAMNAAWQQAAIAALNQGQTPPSFDEYAAQHGGVPVVDFSGTGAGSSSGGSGSGSGNAGSGDNGSGNGSSSGSNGGETGSGSGSGSGSQPAPAPEPAPAPAPAPAPQDPSNSGTGSGNNDNGSGSSTPTPPPSQDDGSEQCEGDNDNAGSNSGDDDESCDAEGSGSGSQPAPTQVQQQKPPATTPAPSPAPSDPAAPSTGGSQFTGKATFYDPSVGYGSCGWVKSNSDLIVALNSAQMQADWPLPKNPNNNPLCGREVLLKHDGKQIKAQITDTCPGCQGANALDLSQAAFNALASDYERDVQHSFSVQWSFV